eukprot:3940922-Rhodomonas_salina.3
MVSCHASVSRIWYRAARSVVPQTSAPKSKPPPPLLHLISHRLARISSGVDTPGFLTQQQGPKTNVTNGPGSSAAATGAPTAATINSQVRRLCAYAYLIPGRVLRRRTSGSRRRYPSTRLRHLTYRPTFNAIAFYISSYGTPTACGTELGYAATRHDGSGGGEREPAPCSKEPMLLRGAYAMSGTDRGYAATRFAIVPPYDFATGLQYGVCGSLELNTRNRSFSTICTRRAAERELRALHRDVFVELKVCLCVCDTHTHTQTDRQTHRHTDRHTAVQTRTRLHTDRQTHMDAHAHSGEGAEHPAQGLRWTQGVCV